MTKGEPGYTFQSSPVSLRKWPNSPPALCPVAAPASFTCRSPCLSSPSPRVAFGMLAL